MTKSLDLNVYRASSYFSFAVGLVSYWITNDASTSGMLFANACFWHLVADRGEAKLDSDT